MYQPEFCCQMSLFSLTFYGAGVSHMDIEKKKSAERIAIKGEAKSKSALNSSNALNSPKSPSEEAPKNPQSPSWGHIESDLKDALNTWSDLTHELANKISPEEKQLQEIKNLLGTLRDKLKEFSEDNGDSLPNNPSASNTDKNNSESK
jgi:hypothetical protein